LVDHFGEAARWERIVFNLPQAPAECKARNQIQRHRALLRDFCASASAALAPHGQLWISLLAGQGGTPLDPIQRQPGDTWQLALEAASSGLLVCQVGEANLEALEEAGYTPAGRRGNQGNHNQPLGKRRKQKGMVVHVLTAARPGDGAGAPQSISPFEWALDNSFWLTSEAPPDAASMLTHCRAALGPEAAHAIAEQPSLVDAYERPSDGRRAQTYRFLYRSSVLPLCKAYALELNAKVTEALTSHFEPRNAAANSNADANANCVSNDFGDTEAVDPQGSPPAS